MNLGQIFYFCENTISLGKTKKWGVEIPTPSHLLGFPEDLLRQILLPPGERHGQDDFFFVDVGRQRLRHDRHVLALHEASKRLVEDVRAPVAPLLERPERAPVPKAPNSINSPRHEKQRGSEVLVGTR